MALESLRSLSDDELVSSLDEVLGRDHRVEAEIVAHIVEVDARRLFARFAAPSLYAYCTDVLHFSEAEAYMRIAVARASRRHPMLLEHLADGRIHLTGVAKLAPHLTAENRELLLSRAVHKTKRQIEDLLAETFPRPDVPTVVRRLPERPASGLSAVPALAEPGPDVVAPPGELGPDRPGPAIQLRPDAVRRPTVRPLSPARYKFEFTAGAEFRDKLEELRALLRPEVPDGDLVAVLEKAVAEMLERRKARRFSQTARPRNGRRQRGSGRHVSAEVRRTVYQRDQGRCCYVDRRGRRCPERHHLEYHHRHPFALGGESTVENICLMCPAHNRYLAELDYGREAMSRHRLETKGRTAAEVAWR
jgi:5-methylcytosine-specific restriction endonuclease McrA